MNQIFECQCAVYSTTFRIRNMINAVGPCAVPQGQIELMGL